MADASHPSASTTNASSPRVAVARTAKLFIGGAFPRSESGRTYAVTGADGTFLANVSQGSRKDIRDAVTAARGAAGGWAARTAYNRGQVLYRIAEMIEGRRGQLAGEVAAAEGIDLDAAGAEVDAAVDRWVWYAGWTDKIAQVLGNANPVAGPFFNVSTPEPVGVVGVIAPQDSSLLGLVSVIAPALAGGNVVVCVPSQDRPLPAVSLGEVLATSDVPGGVVNLVTGHTAELAPVLASHMDVAALDLSGADPATVADLQRAAADSTTRVVATPPAEVTDGHAESTTVSTAWHTPPTTARMRGALELKTVWHPAGT